MRAAKGMAIAGSGVLHYSEEKGLKDSFRSGAAVEKRVSLSDTECTIPPTYARFVSTSDGTCSFPSR